MQNLLNKAFNSGFIQVFIANIVSQLVAFGGSIIYVRLMGQEQFGIYAFSYTIISFFLLLNGFGAASGILQFVSKAQSNEVELAYLKYAIKLGMIFNCGLSIAIFIYAYFFTLPIANAKIILCSMAFFPIGRLYIDIFLAYLRATQQNNLLAKFAISVNLLLLLCNVIGIIVHGLVGFVIATYIAYGIILILSLVVYKLPNVFALKTTAINYKQFFSYSVYVTIGNAFAQLIFLLDIIVLGYVVKDAISVAEYKVATVIPFAINFIPGVVSTFFYPYFAKNSNNINYIKHLKAKIQKAMFIFSFTISMLLIILAKPIILIIFGHQYQASIIPFQILAFGFWILATFRNINGNILASLGKAKVSMLFNLGIFIFNLILTYALVKLFGIIGAAVGVILVYTISGILSSILLKQFLR
jgi:O-antigen/teichoic acid export membrane protein